MTNVLLQLERDIINGVCYQPYEKCLEQQKGRANQNRLRNVFNRGVLTFVQRDWTFWKLVESSSD